MGITNSGKTTEQKIIDSSPSIKDNKDKSAKGKAKGDFIVTIGNTEYYGESKKKTWNQTRPYKYLVGVGYDPKEDIWIVIPPDDIVKIALEKQGQHTPNPFVCVGLGETKSKKFKKYRCTYAELPNKIFSAIKQGENNHTIKKAMLDLKDKMEQRVKEDKDHLRKLLLEDKKCP